MDGWMWMTNERIDRFEERERQAVASRSSDTGDFYDGTMETKGQQRRRQWRKSVLFLRKGGTERKRKEERLREREARGADKGVVVE